MKIGHLSEKDAADLKAFHCKVRGTQKVDFTLYDKMKAELRLFDWQSAFVSK